MKTANVCPSTRFSVALDKDALGCPHVPYNNNGLMQDQVQQSSGQLLTHIDIMS